MKKIVITGATSFIGKRLAYLTSSQGWQTVAVVRKNSDKTVELKSLPNISIIELNMDEYHLLGEKAGFADCLVCLAWDGTRGASRRNESLQKNNYEYSLQAIQSMIKAGCRKIITAGSQAEYGNCSGVITEDTECNPNTEYGKYKLRLFDSVKKLCDSEDISYKEPRIFSIYGPGDYKDTLIMSLINKMKSNETCEMTECIQKWDYLYVDDAVKAIFNLCTVDCPDGAYNLASGDVRQLKDYVEEMYEVLDSNSELKYGAIPYPDSGMVSIQPSIEKICKETLWNAETKFKDGLKAIIGTDESTIGI